MREIWSQIRNVNVLIVFVLFLQLLIIGSSVEVEADETNGNLLKNPSFEELEDNIPVSWKAMSSSDWGSDTIEVSPDAARTGENGIKMNISSDDYWIRQTVEIEGGEVYALSSWVKTELSGKGKAQMKIEFYHDTTDADGWIGGVHGEGYDSFDDWGHIEMREEAPENANVAQVYLRVRAPGTVYFDDADFRVSKKQSEVDIRTDQTYYYEDVEKGTVSGTITADDGDYEDKVVDVQIYSEIDDSVIEDEELPATRDFHYSFDPRSLEFQEPYTVRVTLKTRDGDTLFKDEETIYRWERPTALRDDGTILVDGEPFFPIIGYHVPVEDYPKVTGSINTVQSERGKVDNEITKKQLDEAHENGLKVFYTLYPDVWNMDGPNGYDYVRKKVEAFKDHPAIVGWMISDEPEAYVNQGHPTIIEDLSKVYRIIRSIDPVHPTYMVVSKSEHFDTLGKLTDILVTDPYPLDAEPITKVSDHMNVAKELYPDKPIYHILQSFMLHHHKRYTYLPTMDELRNMAYQAVLRDTQGFAYYSFTDPDWDLLESELYPDIIDFTNDEMPYISELILDGKRIDTFQDDNVQWGLWEQDDELYVASVNVTDEEQPVTVPLPDAGYHMDVIAPERSHANLFEDELTLKLAPLESTLIKLTEAISSSDIKASVDHFEQDGAFESGRVAHALKLHLKAIKHFEEQDTPEKVIKHMKSFKQLVDHQKEKNMVSEDAHQHLIDDADLVIQRMLDSLLQIDLDIQSTDMLPGEKLILKANLENRSDEEIKDIKLTLPWPEELETDPETTVIDELDSGEKTDITFEVEVPDHIEVGEYLFNADVQFDYHNIELGYSKERALTISPPIVTELNITEVDAKSSGEYPVSIRLRNNASESVDVTLESSGPEDIELGWEDPIQLDPNEFTNVEGILHIAESLSEGNYDVTIKASVNGNVIDELPLHVVLDKNLIENSGFEKESSGRPISWSSKDEWKSGEVALSSDAARTGDSGIRMSTDSIDDHWIMQSQIAIKGGKAYELSAWLKSNIKANGKAQMKVEFSKDGKGTIGQVWSDEFGSFDDWENIKMEVVAPEEASSIRVFYRLYGPGTAHYDDVSLRLIEDYDYRNLIENDGFEQSSNDIPTSWSSKDGWKSGEVISTEEAARTGDKGIKMSTDSTDDHWIRQTVKGLKSNRTYEFSAWLKSDIQPDGKARMKVEFSKDGVGTVDQVWSEEFGSFEEWENVKMEVTVPPEANSARAFIRLYGPGTAYYDDVSFRLIE